MDPIHSILPPVLLGDESQWVYPEASRFTQFLIRAQASKAWRNITDDASRISAAKLGLETLFCLSRGSDKGFVYFFRPSKSNSKSFVLTYAYYQVDAGSSNRIFVGDIRILGKKNGSLLILQPTESTNKEKLKIASQAATPKAMVKLLCPKGLVPISLAEVDAVGESHRAKWQGRIVQEDCSVCLENLASLEDIVQLSCQFHFLHIECARECLQKRQVCPICHAPCSGFEMVNQSWKEALKSNNIAHKRFDEIVQLNAAKSILNKSQ